MAQSDVDAIDPSEWLHVPGHLREGLHEYFRIGRPTGGFLIAVLENNLYEAVVRADPVSYACLRDLAHFLYGSAPRLSYGSPEIVKAWMASGGNPK